MIGGLGMSRDMNPNNVIKVNFSKESRKRNRKKKKYDALDMGLIVFVISGIILTTLWFLL